MLKHTSLIVFLLLSIQNVQSQAYLWLFWDGGPQDQRFHDMAIDKFDNLYVLGTFDRTIGLGGTDTLLSYPFNSNNDNIFLAKYNAQREFQWMRGMQLRKTFGGASNREFGNISIDPSGQVEFRFFMFDTDIELELANDTTVQVNGDHKNLIWSYSPTGTRNKMRDLTDQHISQPFVDDEGELYSTGMYQRGSIFGWLPDSIFIDGRWLNDPIGGGYLGKLDANDQVSILTEFSGEPMGTATLEQDVFGNIIFVGGMQDSLIIEGQTYYSLDKNPTTRASFISKLDSAGNLQWFFPFYSLDDASNAPNHLESDADGNIYFVGQFSGEMIVEGDTLVSVVVDGPTNVTPKNSLYIGKLTPNGDLLWIKTSNSFYRNWIYKFEPVGDDLFAFTGHSIWTAFQVFDSPYLLGNPPNLPTALNYLVYFDKSGNIVNALDLNSLSTLRAEVNARGDFYFGEGVRQGGASEPVGPFTLPNLVDWDFYITKIGNEPNVITGKVFRDENQNGVQEANEPNLPGIAVKRSPDSLVVFTDDSGRYVTYVDMGSYSVSVDSIPYHSFSPVKYDISFTTRDNRDSLNDFGANASPVVDLEGLVTFVTRARLGFTLINQIQVRNLGTIEEAPIVKLLLDDNLNFLQSNVAPSYTLGDTLVWEWDSLAWRDTRVMNVYARVNVNAPTNSPLENELWIEPMNTDIDLSNNYSKSQQMITGAFDPNDKLASPSGNIPPAVIQQGQWLDYTVRFQNVGNDTAFNIVVLDTLDRKLDLGSLEVLASSHPYYFSVDDNRTLEVTFPNVLLVDSTTNEEDSHGFIRYKIKAFNTLGLGDTIENSASIYFDYLDPVKTNTTVNPIAEPNTTGISDRFGEYELLIYPVPVQDVLQIEILGKQEWGKNFRFEVYNLQGQRIHSLQASSFEFQIPTSNWPSGLYTYVLKEKGEILVSGKIMK